MSMFSSSAKQTILEKLIEEVDNLSLQVSFDKETDLYVQRGFDECIVQVMGILKSELRAAKYD